MRVSVSAKLGWRWWRPVDVGAEVGLVSPLDFKSNGGRVASAVGSIPTCSRHQAQHRDLRTDQSSEG